MTSERRQRSNRANARLSTGPKTARGKAWASKNARRHGLNVPVLRDPSLAKEVETMACRIAGEGARGELLARARAIAEAQIDLQRIRLYRLRRMQRALAGPPIDTATLWEDDDLPVGLSEIAAAQLELKRIRRCQKRLREQVRALVAANAAPPSPPSPAAAATEAGDGRPPGVVPPPADRAATANGPKAAVATAPEPQRAEVLVNLASELASLDRYERRALSRRKFAIRVFDAARRRHYGGRRD